MEVKPGYKQTEIGVIPEDWETKTYGDVFRFLSTASFSRDALIDNGDIRYIHYGDIHTKFNGYLDITNSNLPCLQTEQINSYALVKTGDVIMVDASEDYSGIGKSVEVINNCNVKAIAGLHTFLMRDTKQVFVDGYRAYIYAIESVKKQFDFLATGMKVFGVSKNNLKKVVIPVPLKDEQIQIADYLADIGSLITSLEKLIEKKKNIKQGVMQELLTGKIRLPGFTGGWDTKTLGSLSRINTGSKNTDDNNPEGKYPFFIRSQIVERIDTYSFQGEAILIPGEGGIGTIYHYINGMFDYHQRVYKISNFDSSVDGKYIYYYLKQHFHDHAMNNSVKATVDSLRLPTFVNFQMTLPSKDEQSAIAETLSDMELGIRALEQRLKKTQLIKQAVMQELLTGRIRLV